MTLELSPPVATVAGDAEWLYESDTPTPVKQNTPLSIPFTVPSSGTVVVVYKQRTVSSGQTRRYRVIGVYRDGATDAVASGSTTSNGGRYTDDTTPYTLFAPVSEGEHYVQFSTSASYLEFDVVSIRVGHIPDA